MDINKYLSFMNEQVIEVTESVSWQFQSKLWYNVIEGNPVVSGLSKFSWHMVHGDKTDYQPTMPSGYTYLEGRVFGDPPKPKVLRSGTLRKKYTMFNNQSYVPGLNDNLGKDYFGFIDDGIRRAALATDINDTANITGVRIA